MNRHDQGWNASHHPKLPTSRSATGQERGVLAILRSLVPRRLLSARELSELAERQANRLHALAGYPSFPLPQELITELPRISVQLDPHLPVSGADQWAGGRWHITINAVEPWQRQRFTLAHEFAHVLMHPFTETVFAGPDAAEYAADAFAACLLMPRREVLRLWRLGVRGTADLAQHFGVSERALRVRLGALDLRPAVPRHLPPDGETSRTSTYLRRAEPQLAGGRP